MIAFIYCGSAPEEGKGERCYFRQFNSLVSGYPPRPVMWVQAVDLNPLTVERNT